MFDKVDDIILKLDLPTNPLSPMTLPPLSLSLSLFLFPVSQSHEVFYFGELGRYGGITFSTAYQEKWNEVKVKLVPELSAFLEQFVASSIGEAFNRSIPYDSERWGKEAVPLETLINEAQDWFANREQWLEQNINASSAIKSIKAEEQPTLIYSIEGRRLKSLSKGINIIRQRDGRTKKIIITSK